MWRTASLIALLLVTTASGHASSALLTGSLGRWLDTEAGPELAETLSTHPRFKGEPIRIVAMSDGSVASSSNQLVDAVRDALTRILLDKPGVHLVWDSPQSDCLPQHEANYLLGIEVKNSGSRNYRLTLSMVDVHEGMWVAGVNLSWAGRLTTGERAALAQPLQNQAPGSISNPLPVNHSERIAEILSADAKCNLKARFPGVVYVDHAADADPSRSAVLSEVQQQLGQTALAMTSTRTDAEWLMRIDHEQTGSATARWTLALHDRGNPATVQHLASVHVVASYGNSLGETAAVRPAPSGKLSEFRLTEAQARGICRSPEPGTACKEVSIDVFEPVYLIVFYTRDGEIDAFGCHDRLEKKRSGTHTYRVQFPMSADTLGRPSAGVYALATTDRSVAASFNRHFNAAPGACSTMRRESSNMDQWFARLLTLLESNERDVDWQSLHLGTREHQLIRL